MAPRFTKNMRKAPEPSWINQKENQIKSRKVKREKLWIYTIPVTHSGEERHCVKGVKGEFFEGLMEEKGTGVLRRILRL